MYSTKRWSTGSRPESSSIKCETWLGWAVILITTLTYILTLERDVSWWDCGEFITSAYGLEVGHPPGSPLYWLLAHNIMLLGEAVNSLFNLEVGLPWWCNLLSALAGGWTAGMLYWTLIEWRRGRDTDPADNKSYKWIAAAGALCYGWCDTAWFSAVESEVYSLAMAIASTMLWGMVRWKNTQDYGHRVRWIVLECLLLGLGLSVHLLCLLVMPAMALILLQEKIKGWWKPRSWWIVGLMMLLIGLSPYLIVPIRAQADPPLNSVGDPTAANLKRYITRDQYEKAPLWPRMWRHRDNTDLYAQHWSRKGGEWEYLFTYQLGYMYGRYLLWNFSGRYNNRQGYGSLQNGQFITGIPPIDKAVTGTGAKVPSGLGNKSHNRYFMIPLLLGIFGAVCQYNRNRRAFRATLTLFLMGGVVLAFYLNTPCYEPRERDYAYILSFYAFAIWIGSVESSRTRINTAIAVVVLLTALWMGIENWDDHDRSHRMTAHDAGLNLLNSCNSNAILFTLGDNDTFPLWCLQQVEKERTDIRVENISLMGVRNFLNLIESNHWEHPVYLTHYASARYGSWFENRLQLEGNVYRLYPEECDSIAIYESFRKMMESLKWHPVREDICLDEISERFITQYWKDVIAVSQQLDACGEQQKARQLVAKTLTELPVFTLQDPELIYEIIRFAPQEIPAYKTRLHEETTYYHTLSTITRRYLPYQIPPRESVLQKIQNWK